MVSDKQLEHISNLYQDKCCVTKLDKAIQSIIKELKEYRAIGSIEEVSRKYNIDFVKKEMKLNSRAWNRHENFIMLDKALRIVEAGL